MHDGAILSKGGRIHTSLRNMLVKRRHVSRSSTFTRAFNGIRMCYLPILKTATVGH
jgi:hypothetical protein